MPYYVRKYVRRERKTCTSDLMAYIHELRAADVAAAAATSQPAARPAAAVRAPRARPIAAPKRVDLAGLWAELQAALSAAHDAGVGAAADADAAGFLKNAIYAAQCKVAEAGAAAPQPLLKNPGDDSLVCGVPAALGGNRGKKRSRAQSKPAAADGGDAPPQKLLPAFLPGRAKKPKHLLAQLLATPGAPQPPPPLPSLPSLPIELVRRAHDVMDKKRLQNVVFEDDERRILRAACAGSCGESYDVYLEVMPEGHVVSTCVGAGTWQRTRLRRAPPPGFPRLLTPLLHRAGARAPRRKARTASTRWRWCCGETLTLRRAARGASLPLPLPPPRPRRPLRRQRRQQLRLRRSAPGAPWRSSRCSQRRGADAP